MSDSILEINGWTIYAHPVFLYQLEAMIEAVSRGIGIGFIFNREQNEDPRSLTRPLRELRGANRNMLVYLKPRRRRRSVQALLDVARDFV